MYLFPDKLATADTESIRSDLQKYLAAGFKERDHFNTRPQRDLNKNYPSGYWIIDDVHTSSHFPALQKWIEATKLPFVDAKICRLVVDQYIPPHYDTHPGHKIFLPIIVPEPGFCSLRVHEDDSRESKVLETFYYYDGLPILMDGRASHSATAPLHFDRTIVQLYLPEYFTIEDLLAKNKRCVKNNFAQFFE